MNTLVELINSMETREDDENFKNAVDYFFEELELGNEEEGLLPQPDHFALRQYKKYKLAAGLIYSNGLPNQKSIIIAVTRLRHRRTDATTQLYGRGKGGKDKCCTIKGLTKSTSLCNSLILKKFQKYVPQTPLFLTYIWGDK
jgi:hypothetical protein